ncbi:hypothetical protein FRC17_000265 [Serendipita sp. 399]|nr:hypothetical protein FRC17_000265 [Serendipita sp. 399]
MLPSFKLPKLRHLFVNTNALPQDITLKDFIGPYSQTLQSIAITVRSGSGRPPDHEFPSWTEYPMLEELALDPVLMLNFAPLPRTHPLRRLHAPQWRRSDIENWLESDHLEKVQLLNAVFTDYGDVVNRSTGATSLVLWKDEMDALLARARERGIELVVGGSWQSVE